MKINVLLIVCAFFCLKVHGQIEFNKSKVDSLSFPVDVKLSDFDNDGDLDIVCEARKINQLLYYENLDGKGNYGEPSIVSDSIIQYTTLLSVDIDNDGFKDIIVSGGKENSKGEVSWYRNKGEKGKFTSKKEIAVLNQSDYIWSIYTSDIDGDGDFDIVSSGHDRVVWYENLDGKGNFSNENIITSGIYVVKSVFCVDVDGDGDFDVVSGSEDKKLAWYKNLDGKGNFGEQKVVFEGKDTVKEVISFDVDSDGDMDLVWSTFAIIPSFNSDVFWSENLNGKGVFGKAKLITNTENVISLKFEDIDNDSDFDIIFTSRFKGIYYIENISNGYFADKQLLKKRFCYVVDTGDVDNDGDVDLVSTFGGKVGTGLFYFQNNGLSNNKVSGQLLFDYNFDGCDNQDIKISDLVIKAVSKDTTVSSVSMKNGFYQLFLDKGDYKIELPSKFLSNRYNVTPENYTFNFDGNKTIEIANFCLEAKGEFDDVDITILPVQEARPGFTSKYELVFKNSGTTQLNGTINLEFNGEKLDFKSTNGTVIDATENSLFFNYYNLKPFENQTIFIEFDVLKPPTVNIDDVLKFTARITPLENDETKNDNTFVLEQVVIGSYDPNDIAVLQGDSILEEKKEEYLNYLIRFQNTGTASAINVKVDNVLDDNLDWNTIQLQSTSHDGRVKIVNDNQVSFIFDNIHLADSTSNEPDSHGYIAYKIKPKNIIKVGDVISNQASIYFDFNEPVITNKVTTEITAPLMVSDFNRKVFFVYPNPTTGILKIESALKIKEIQVVNSIGQVIIENQNKRYINLSNLKPNLYFVKIIGENQVKEIKKVVVKH